MMSRTIYQFRAPKNNSLFIKLVQYIIEPIMLLFIPKISKIEVDPGDLSLLKKLKGKRVILTPNHGEMTEPYVIFALSRMLHEKFNYLTAREVFEDYFPAGRLLQALGCYSVIRGVPDRNALRATTEILMKGKHWLVIFPEGVAMGLSDALMPFQPGIGQFAFRAYDELTKKGEDFHIVLVPIAIKTFYTQNMDNSFDQALRRLEVRLLPGTDQTKKDYLARLLSLGEALLKSREKEYGVLPRPDASFSERIHFMKELIITTTASQIGVDDHPSQILPDRLRVLINALDRISHQQNQEKGHDQESFQALRDRLKVLRRSLETATNFMALDPGYLELEMTVERFLDIVGLLEREVFGKRRFWGQRKAIIRVGEPVDLNDFAGQYRISRKETFQEISGVLEAKVRKMLLELSSRSEPMRLMRKEG
jgi:1-acyl-sn-glycerol-3-phosphate acyltransferase